MRASAQHIGNNSREGIKPTALHTREFKNIMIINYIVTIRTIFTVRDILSDAESIKNIS